MINLLTMLLCVCLPATSLDYDRLFKAVSVVESGGNPKAYNKGEDAAGIVQIRPCVVADCNRVQKKVRFSLKDRWSKDKSKQMFKIYLGYWVPRSGKATDEVAARIWNGGPSGYKKQSTHKYWARVKGTLDE